MKILKLFTQVKSLKINSWHPKYLKSLDMDGLLKHFAQTVTSLELVNCTLNSSGLVYLTSPFHRIDNLVINVTGHRVRHEIVDYDLSGAQYVSEGILISNHSFRRITRISSRYERSEDVSSISVRFCQKDEEMERLFKVPKNLLSICVGSSWKKGRRLHPRSALHSNSSHMTLPRCRRPLIVCSTPKLIDISRGPHVRCE